MLDEETALRRTALLQEVERDPMRQLQKKWLVVILLHGGVGCGCVKGLLFLLILLMVLDQMSSGKAPHCKGGLSERDLRRGKPSVVVEICCRGRLLPSSRRASLRATLLPRQSFFGELSTFHGLNL